MTADSRFAALAAPGVRGLQTGKFLFGCLLSLAYCCQLLTEFGLC